VQSAPPVRSGPSPGLAPCRGPLTLPSHDDQQQPRSGLDPVRRMSRLRVRSEASGSRSTAQLLLRVLRLGWKYRWWFLLSLLLSALAAASAGYVVIAVDQIVRAFSSVQGVMDGNSASPAETLARSQALLQRIALTLLALAPVVAVTAWAAYLTAEKLANMCIRDLRIDFVGHLVELDLGFHTRIVKGDLLTRMMADLGGVRIMVQRIYSRILQRPFEFFAYVAYAVYLDWRSGILFLGCIIPVGIVLIRLITKLKRRARSAREALAENLVVFEQLTSGIRVIKSMGSSERERTRFSGSNQQVYNRQMRMARTKAQSEAITNGSIFLMLAVVLYLGALMFGKGTIEPAVLMAVLIALSRATTVLREIQQAVASLIEQIPSAERIFAIFDQRSCLPEDPALPTCPVPRNCIALTGVRFRYDPAAQDVLCGIDLIIPVGQTVALVGASGGGKSTLLDLVPRLHEVTGGTVTWDGVDVRGYQPHSIVGNCAIVQQDSFLFDDSILENIRYGRPEATQAEIEVAARRANIHDDILRLEGGEGYQTPVGDRGSRLSGGQRQRVAIARALLRDAPVLLLDEPTSALDAGSEAHVQAALAELMKGRTTVIIAHRLATVRHAHCIHVLGGKDDGDMQGRIMESGTHAELIERGGAYAALARNQTLA